MKAYQDMINEVLATGTRKENRTGVDTISTFGHYYELCWDPNIYPEAPGPKDHRHCIDKPSYTMMPTGWDAADLHDYQIAPGLPVPLLTTKDVSWKNIVVEMLWFLSGSTDIEILKRHKCKFWDPWADENGHVPSAYGSFWANFPAAQTPEPVSPREPSGNDYEKPTFPEEPVEPNHEWSGKTFESQNHGTFKVLRKSGLDNEGRSLFDIQFADSGYVKRCVRRDVIQNGEVRDRYTPTVHGVGYYGEQRTRTSLDKDLRKVWLHMMERCYSPDCKEYPWYGLKGVTVCKRWHNFANFHADCMKLPNWTNKRDNPKKYALDKDYYSSRCYSPTTCVWLPHEDNRLYAHAEAIEVTTPEGEEFVVLSASLAEEATGIKKSRILTCLERDEPFEDFSFRRVHSNKGPYRKPLPNNQIKWVLDQLKTNPMSRRLIVSAWAPGNAQTSKLPPCHMVFAFNVQNVEETLESRLERARNSNQELPKQIRDQATDWYKDSPEGRKLLDETLRAAGFEPEVEQRLCLHLTQRSCDLALGVPYNMASYGLLLLLFSHLTGIKPGIFGHTLLDLHIYTKKPDGSMAEYDHIPGLKEQLGRYPRPLPKLVIDPSIKELSDIEALMAPEVSTEEILAKFKLDLYQPCPAIKFKVAV